MINKAKIDKSQIDKQHNQTTTNLKPNILYLSNY
jgi:hypothetical protein